MKILIFAFLLIWASLPQSSKLGVPDSFSHELFDQLLKKHVSATGWVNYQGFKKEEAKLDQYLEKLEKTPPTTAWSSNEKLAYWINAYNAFTIKLVLNHSSQKIESIKDIGDKIKIPFINTPWDIKFINIGGKKMDLNNIEHGIIRKQFNEPRIHFALVCAAKSCPPLRNEAFLGEKLDKQLDSQATAFFNDKTKNEISENRLALSKIMDWYGGDFKGISKIEYINKYAKTKAKKEAKITYKDYDWALNGKL
jgi:Protein of unknown function, DUF547